MGWMDLWVGALLVLIKLRPKEKNLLSQVGTIPLVSTIPTFAPPPTWVSPSAPTSPDFVPAAPPP